MTCGDDFDWTHDMRRWLLEAWFQDISRLLHMSWDLPTLFTLALWYYANKTSISAYKISYSYIHHHAYRRVINKILLSIIIMGLSISLFIMFIRLLLIFSIFSLISAGSDSSVKPLCHDDESIALLKFKESFIVNQSASVAPLVSPKISSWMAQSSDCCTWDGIQCDEITGHVISLDLSNSSFYGSINSSSSLFQLVHLQKFNNFDHSEIPFGVRRLSKFTHLDLS